MARQQKTPNEKELEFLKEYLKDFNGGRAALAAGYSSSSARVTACKILKRPHIVKFLDDYKADIKKRADINTDEMIVLLKEIMMARVTDFIAPDLEGGVDVNEDSANLRAIQEYIVTEKVTETGDVIRNVRLKLRDPVAAMERLARLSGLDKPEQQDVNININIRKRDDNGKTE